MTRLERQRWRVFCELWTVIGHAELLARHLGLSDPWVLSGLVHAVRMFELEDSFRCRAEVEADIQARVDALKAAS